MFEMRLGDDIDDHCTKCKRVTNHVILAIVDEKPVKVRCRTCYNEQNFRECIAPPTRRELKKAALEKEQREAEAAEKKAAAKKGAAKKTTARKTASKKTASKKAAAKKATKKGK